MRNRRLTASSRRYVTIFVRILWGRLEWGVDVASESLPKLVTFNSCGLDMNHIQLSPPRTKVVDQVAHYHRLYPNIQPDRNCCPFRQLLYPMKHVHLYHSHARGRNPSEEAGTRCCSHQPPFVPCRHSGAVLWNIEETRNFRKLYLAASFLLVSAKMLRWMKIVRMVWWRNGAKSRSHSDLYYPFEPYGKSVSCFVS